MNGDTTPQPKSNLIGQRYQLHEALGAGGMGAVYRATDCLTGKTVALKRTTQVMHVREDDTAPTIIPILTRTLTNASSVDEEQARRALVNEYKVLSDLNHPYIIHVYDCGLDDSQQPFYTMPLLDGAQTILEAARQRPPAEKIGLLLQLLEAVAYLHQEGVIHRDLKPSNILVVNGQIKLLDFGLAARRDQRDTLVAGTLLYLAPEVLRGGAATEAADLYAVGVIAYEMFAGSHPYDTSDVMTLLDHLLNKPADLSKLDVHTDVAAVIGRLLAKQPGERCACAEEAMTALSRTFYGWIKTAPYLH